MTVLLPYDSHGRTSDRSAKHLHLRWLLIAAITFDLALWAMIIGLFWALFD